MYRLFIILFLCFPAFLFAKNQQIEFPWKKLEDWAKERNVDSLSVWSEKGIPYWEKNKEQLNWTDQQYHQLAYYYGLTHYNKDFDRSFRLVESAHDFAKKSDEKSFIFKTAYLLGNIYNRQGNFRESAEHYEYAGSTLTAAAKELKKNGLDTDRYQFAVNFSLIGIYRKLGALEKAYHAIEKAETSLLNYNQPEAQFLLAQATSNYFFENKKYEQALEHIKKAATVAQKMNHPNRLRSVLHNQGGIELELGNYNAALALFERSMALADSLQNQEVIAMTSIRLGEVYQKKEQFELAQSHFQRALTISEREDLQLQYADAAMALADLNNQTGRLDRSLNLVNTAISVQKENGQQVKLLSSLPLKKEILKKYRRFEEATATLENYVKLKDSIYTQQTAEKVEELQLKYETAEKEKTIAALENKNALQALRGSRNRLLLVGLVLLLFLIPALVWLYYNNRLRKAKLEAMAAEQNLLRTQMSPHFTFNALTSIQGFLHQKGDYKLGVRLLGKYARLMRQTLEFSRQQWISLADELQFLENYLSIQRVRYQQKFTYSIELSSSIISDEWYLPPMLLQPAIENALVHGQITTKKDGHIQIIVEEDLTHLNITVKDNGIGRKKSTAKTQVSNSYSTKIIEERLDLLRKTYDVKLAYEVTDEPAGGTKVQFRIPQISPEFNPISTENINTIKATT